MFTVFSFCSTPETSGAKELTGRVMLVCSRQRKNDNERKATCIFKIIRVMELKLHDRATGFK